MRRLFASTLIVAASCVAPISPGVVPPRVGVAPPEPRATVDSVPPAPAPPAAEAPPYVPPPPFHVLARTSPDRRITILPGGDDDVWITAGDRAGPSTLDWARVRGATIEPVAGVHQGLPPLEGWAVGVASRDDAMWLVRNVGDPPGRCHGWERVGGSWVDRGEPKPARGPCTLLSVWRPGAAVALVGEAPDIALAAWGPHPAPRLVMPSGGCLFQAVYGLRAWGDGTIAALGIDCTQPDIYAARWAPGVTRPLVFPIVMDPNAPLSVSFPTRDDVVVDGLGEMANQQAFMILTARFGGGSYRVASRQPTDLSLFERVILYGKTMVGAEEGSSRELESYQIIGADLLAVVTTPTGSVLLRNRPVREPLAL